MPERKNSRDEFSNRLAELDLVSSREPSFSDYVNFQSEPLREACAVQGIEMVQYQGMDRLSQKLSAHLPQIPVERSAPKSDGCFEHSLAHKPLPRSLKMQEGAQWWVDLFGCCPLLGGYSVASSVTMTILQMKWWPLMGGYSVASSVTMTILQMKWWPLVVPGFLGLTC